MDEIAFTSAGTQAAALAAKRISSVELLDLYLARLDRLNPRVNAVVTIASEQAREAARAADNARMRGESWGPLHGVPITIKDSIEVEGVRTTCGSPRYANHIPLTDAVVVERLRAAGAVVFGKTNLPTDARDWQSYNEIFGVTTNPWAKNRSPGGSSGGAAAALAAGLTGLEVGSDTAGSIRIPAHYCGIYGLKPSFGIVPPRGHIPGPPGTLGEFDMTVLGPMGRHADDLRLGLDVIAGPSEDRSVAWRLQLPEPVPGRLSDYRVAAWLDDEYCPVSAELVDLMRGVVESLRTAGATVIEVAGPVGLEETMSLFEPLIMTQRGLIESSQEYEAHVAQALSAPHDSNARIARALTTRVREWHELDEARQRMRLRWARFFDDYDVLLCPVTPTAAIPHDTTPDVSARTISVNGALRPYRDQLPWVSTAPLVFLPAAVAPIGITEGGVPVGIQVVAPFLHDLTAIDFVQRLSRLTGGFRPPPGFD